MDTLTLSAVCIFCTAQPLSAPAPITRWEPIIAEASARFAIPEVWIQRIMLSESGGRTTRNGTSIISSAGAMGLMQIMPRTYADLSRRYGFGSNPHDPRDNILAGTAYLHEMYERYGCPFLFAAYHAGSSRFDDYLVRGRALPPATLHYMNGFVPGGIAALRAAAAGRKLLARNAAVLSANDHFSDIYNAPNTPRTIVAGASVKRAHGTNAAFVTTLTGDTLFVPLAARSPYSPRTMDASIGPVCRRTSPTIRIGRSSLHHIGFVIVKQKFTMTAVTMRGRFER